MDPALRDYLLTQQPQQANMEQAQGQFSYNPFDQGIRKAVESARQSLDMTDKQQHKALRRGMLAFTQNMQQQPREKGFFNNFASVGRAAAPAMLAYDDEESNALAENQALSERILAYQAAEQQRLAAEEERAALEEERQWRRDFAERQLGESVRSHNLLDAFRNKSLEQKENLSSKPDEEDPNQLKRVFDTAEETIKKFQKKGTGHRGIAARLAGKYLPGGYQLDEDQTTINTLGEVLKAQLLNKWGKAEFAHIPTISSNNSPQANLAALKVLKELLLEKGERTTIQPTVLENLSQEEDYGFKPDEGE